MKIIVGLGNPGGEYAISRHNIGFITVDELAKRWNATAWRNKHEALIAEAPGRDQILLVKPQTYMNNSGVAVGAIARWYKVAPADIVVIYDDLDLPVGRLRIRAGGGPGGHHGVESLLVHLGNDQFVRVRLGIGRPPEFMTVVNYVLGKFTEPERPVMAETVIRACDAVEAVLADGAAKAMNTFNR